MESCRLIILGSFILIEFKLNGRFFFLEGILVIMVFVFSKLLERLVSEVIKKKDWYKLRIFYFGGGGLGL